MVTSFVVLKFVKGALLVPRMGGLATRPPYWNRGGMSSCTAFGKISGMPESPRVLRVNKSGCPWSGRMSIELWLYPTVASTNVVEPREPAVVNEYPRRG